MNPLICRILNGRARRRGVEIWPRPRKGSIPGPGTRLTTWGGGRAGSRPASRPPIPSSTRGKWCGTSGGTSTTPFSSATAGLFTYRPWRGTALRRKSRRQVVEVGPHRAASEGSPWPVAATSGSRSARVATDPAAAPQSGVKYMGGPCNSRRWVEDGQGRLLFRGHEGVAGDQGPVGVPEQGDVAWGVARREDPPPTGEAGDRSVLGQRLHAVAEVDRAPGDRSRTGWTSAPRPRSGRAAGRRTGPSGRAVPSRWA